jgi:RNA polymerase sigma-70 factor (ECF subfamily)
MGVHPSPSRAAFATTRWSLVRAAGTGGSAPEEALERLCRGYWAPIYAFVRRKGFSPPDAQDLTQAFFARVLRRETFSQADPRRGRFRTFLLSALSCFLADEHRKATRQKRGGGQELLSLEGSQMEEQFLEVPSPEAGPGELFDRRWRLSLLQQALRRLEAEFVAADKARDFALLKEFLTAPATVGAYDPVAAELGTQPRTVAVMIHRLRRRFRELVREEVAQTVTDPTEFEEELRQLFG